MFDDMIVDMEPNKKLCPIEVNSKKTKGRKLNISLVFISQSFFKSPKTIRVDETLYFI